MKIKNILIHNFGQFHNKKIEFSPGLNIIYGENESGKSTLHSYLLGMLFGMDKARGRKSGKDTYTQYEPWNSNSFYSGEMVFEVDGKDFRLERNFYHKEKKSTLMNLEDGEMLSEEFGDLQMLLGGINKDMYENTYCVSQASVVTGKGMAAYVQEYMANAATAGEGNYQIQKALKKLQAQKLQASKALCRETELRQHEIDKLEIEKMLLEEDIEEDVEKEADAKTEKTHLLVLVLGCFITAIWFLAAIWLTIPLNITVIEGGIVLALTIAASVYLRFYEKTRLRQGKGEKGTLTMAIREKQTRLFNLLEQQNELFAPNEREVELQQYMSACDLASKTIEQLTGEIYEDFGDKINEKTSAILSAITDGKYDKIDINEKMEVSVSQGGRNHRPEQLSYGTLEQIYFALRMSLGEILVQEEPMPILLDEVFARYDESRIRQALRWMGRQNKQMILFTCQKREMAYLDEMNITYHKIELEGR